MSMNIHPTGDSKEVKVTAHKSYDEGNTIEAAPHFILSAATAVAAGVQYMKYNNPAAAGMAAAFSLGSYYAGSTVYSGNYQWGNLVGTLGAIGLVATTLPVAYRTGDLYATALSSIGTYAGMVYAFKSWDGWQVKAHRTK